MAMCSGGSMSMLRTFYRAAYGFDVPRMFNCPDCNSRFKVTRRYTQIDDIIADRVVSIKSGSFPVELWNCKKDVGTFFYFDCPMCARRMFTRGMSSKVYQRITDQGFWSGLLSLETDAVDVPDGNCRSIVSRNQVAFAKFEHLTLFKTIYDANTGLYYEIEYFHGKSIV